MDEFNSCTKFLGHYYGEEIKTVILNNLESCDSFQFSVSFILKSGFEILSRGIEKALERGANGILITTDYMRITNEYVLNKLLELQNKYKNFSVYFLQTHNVSDYKSFHTKGYIFLKDKVASVIIGSSNMSETALTKKGGEWSLYSTTYKSFNLFKDINNEFLKNINEIKFRLSKKQIEEYVNGYLNVVFQEVKPNFMQLNALAALDELRTKQSKDRALIVAAMGSGKTYLSAFDTKQIGAERVLYICHNEEILSKARIEYENVYGSSKTYGLFTGNEKNKAADVIFATVQTMHKFLNEFNDTTFDYIVIDECHHAPATTYKKIIEYFKPRFLLGMTGTPDRNDKLSALKMFGDNVPYELNLRDAISEGLIMPFTYYSIYDKDLDYDSKTLDESIVNSMISASHLSFIKSNIEAHLKEIDGKLKCLGFCINVEQAKRMSELFTSLGIKSTYVAGNIPTELRKKAYKNLQDENNALKIIFSVNVMNEGVDLPAVNMALFLRPTESSIVFIQQLGRTLRKYPNKKKPVILDFIGCKYARSTFIAWALGELVDAPVLTKPILLNLISGESKNLADIGVEIITDEKSKEEIQKYLRKSNFNSHDILTKSYFDFKNQINSSSFPSHADYLCEMSGFDLMRIIQTNGSYYNFLRRIKEKNIPDFNAQQVKFIEYLCDFLPLSRIYEFAILKVLIKKGPMDISTLKSEAENLIVEDYSFNIESFEHALKVLKFETFGEKTKEKAFTYLKIKKNGKYFIDIDCEQLSINDCNGYSVLYFENDEFRNFCLDILDYGIKHYKKDHKFDGSNFELYKGYSRREFTRVECSKSIYVSQSGIISLRDSDSKAFFVDLVKDKEKDDNLNYKDRFLTKNKFIWESQTGTVIGNNKYNNLLKLKRIELFVRKYKQEDSINLPYIYLGKCKIQNPKNTDNKGKTVEFECILENELPDNLFEQFNIDLDN